MITRLLPLALLALAACSGAAPDNEGASNIAASRTGEPKTRTPAGDSTTFSGSPRTSVETHQADLVGRYKGVEGMYLVVRHGTSPGKYRLEMQWDLDNKGEFAGVARGDGIAFTRNGEDLMLRPTDGDATGLKWLVGQKECLTVKPGEGYCRIRLLR
ncbi:hypothetical protein [uncultured Sphingomonas sp.]|uniref:hypothetical protein n=1 Tax=uncultured Sphingomonas sp. TaxID=158754 RepID=UPI002637B107|nr:hypothetical protein [uncultured Sphingomonas sp.]